MWIYLFFIKSVLETKAHTHAHTHIRTLFHTKPHTSTTQSESKYVQASSGRWMKGKAQKSRTKNGHMFLRYNKKTCSISINSTGHILDKCFWGSIFLSAFFNLLKFLFFFSKREGDTDRQTAPFCFERAKWKCQVKGTGLFSSVACSRASCCLVHRSCILCRPQQHWPARLPSILQKEEVPPQSLAVCRGKGSLLKAAAPVLANGTDACDWKYRSQRRVKEKLVCYMGLRKETHKHWRQANK